MRAFLAVRRGRRFRLAFFFPDSITRLILVTWQTLERLFFLRTCCKRKAFRDTRLCLRTYRYLFLLSTRDVWFLAVVRRRVGAKAPAKQCCQPSENEKCRAWFLTHDNIHHSHPGSKTLSLPVKPTRRPCLVTACNDGGLAYNIVGAVFATMHVIPHMTRAGSTSDSPLAYHPLVFAYGGRPFAWEWCISIILHILTRCKPLNCGSSPYRRLQLDMKTLYLKRRT